MGCYLQLCRLDECHLALYESCFYLLVIFFIAGYDNEFLILEHGYDCPICTMCLRDPYQTDCGHRFCRNCITRWLRYNIRLAINSNWENMAGCSFHS